MFRKMGGTTAYLILRHVQKRQARAVHEAVQVLQRVLGEVHLLELDAHTASTHM